MTSVFMDREDLLFLEGFDAAIVGVGRRCGQPDIVAYDADKIIAILMMDHGMSEEDAHEFYEFNIVGAWLGDDTPVFIVLGNPVNQ